MTAKTKKSVAKVAKQKTLPKEASVAFNESTLKSISILASSILYQAPQFTNQASPQNIIGTADLMFKYMTNEINVTPPEAAPAAAA